MVCFIWREAVFPRDQKEEIRRFDEENSRNFRALNFDNEMTRLKILMLGQAEKKLLKL